MNENNFDESIRAVIAALNEVIAVNSNSEQPIQADDLKQVIEKHNIQNIDSQIIREAYWSVANNANEQKFSEYYRAESYLQKGRSLIEDSGKESNQGHYENNMPMLDMDALRYRYNNDKESFK